MKVEGRAEDAGDLHPDVLERQDYLARARQAAFKQRSIPIHVLGASDGEPRT